MCRKQHIHSTTPDSIGSGRYRLSERVIVSTFGSLAASPLPRVMVLMAAKIHASSHTNDLWIAASAVHSRTRKGVARRRSLVCSAPPPERGRSSKGSAPNADWSLDPSRGTGRSVAVHVALSPRLREIVDALPLRPGLRVIEIGCGPGAAAKEVARRVGPTGHVLAVDRSTKAIGQFVASASDLIAAGVLSVRNISCEELVLTPDEEPYDLAFAVRVGALDGRHPHAEARALERLARAIVPGGRLFVDGGDPLRELTLSAPG